MPKVVLGDSGRVLQIFANLISNSIKFTTCKWGNTIKLVQEQLKQTINEWSVLVTAGYIILRGWCETVDTESKKRESYLHPKESWCAQKLKRKREAAQGKICSKKDNKMMIWFEVDDTGCGKNTYIYIWNATTHSNLSWFSYIRNWSWQMGISFREFWASRSVNY